MDMNPNSKPSSEEKDQIQVAGEDKEAVQSSRLPKLLLGVVLAVLILALPLTACIRGLRLGEKLGLVNAQPDGLDWNLNLEDPETKEEFEKLQLIYRQLKNNYYEELSDAELLRAMYDGMMSKVGSVYTFYLDKESNTAQQESMSGEYAGIGAQVSQQKNTYLVSDLFDGSPALEAGLEIGDVFISVNGKEVSEFKDVSAMAAEVKGEPGTKVTLVMYRSSQEKELTFEIERRKITTADLHYEMIEDQIGYIRVVQFDAGVSDNFKKALIDLQEQGAKTFIFDLRNNGGGFAYEAIQMLETLLEPGVVATAKGRTNGVPFVDEWKTEKDPIVPQDWTHEILINENSASASELFSGALRDYGKANLVGQKSFGKGVGTITQQLSDGSAIQITNFYYYLPKGDTVQDKGLKPAVEVALDEKWKGKTVTQIPRDQDLQLQKALELAREKIK